MPPINQFIILTNQKTAKTIMITTKISKKQALFFSLFVNKESLSDFISYLRCSLISKESSSFF